MFIFIFILCSRLLILIINIYLAKKWECMNHTIKYTITNMNKVIHYMYLFKQIGIVQLSYFH